MNVALYNVGLLAIFLGLVLFYYDRRRRRREPPSEIKMAGIGSVRGTRSFALISFGILLMAVASWT